MPTFTIAQSCSELFPGPPATSGRVTFPFSTCGPLPTLHFDQLHSRIDPENYVGS